MQNTVYECKQNGEVFFSSLCVTSFRFGNYPDNGLVTEQPQYSVVVCIFHILQNTEIQLISNDLRLIFTYSLLLASPCIFHCSRHTFGTLAILAGCDILTVSKLLGHKSVKVFFLSLCIGHIGIFCGIDGAVVHIVILCPA